MHVFPETPALHEQTPVIALQPVHVDPSMLHPQAEKIFVSLDLLDLLIILLYLWW